MCVETILRLLKETIVEFRDAKKKLPGKPTTKTLRLWATKGTSDRKGGRIILEAIKLGPHPATSMEAYARFCLAVTKATKYGKRRS